MTRWCLVVVLLVSTAAPAAALAQDGGANPFGPLPQTPQAPPDEPEPQRIERDVEDDGFGGTDFVLIIGTTGLIFAAVAFFITRDMRKTVGARRKRRRRGLRGSGRPAADAAQALGGDPRHRPGSQKSRAKAQQRAKTKAARRQRRRSRSR